MHFKTNPNKRLHFDYMCFTTEFYFGFVHINTLCKKGLHDNINTRQTLEMSRKRKERVDATEISGSLSSSVANIRLKRKTSKAHEAGLSEHYIKQLLNTHTLSRMHTQACADKQKNIGNWARFPWTLLFSGLPTKITAILKIDRKRE